jgi:carboxymethylenebutenolidase
MGQFVTIKSAQGTEYRAYAAGPEDAKNAILFVHDYFGMSDAVKESVERLGAAGYRVLAVDLYKGKSASTNDAATLLMNAKDPKETRQILLTAIESLKRPGRKLASVGFSAGGIDAMNANLLAPDLFSATAIIYGGSYDKIEKERLGTLKSPVLAITGSLDDWPLQAALNFLAQEKDKSLELYVYPGADHGYAQPLFNNGKNLNAEATRVTWMLLEDFLARNLK